MSPIQHNRLFSLIGSLALATLFCTPSFAEDTRLISIGHRIGFSEKTPPIGKTAKILLPHDRRRGRIQPSLVMAAQWELMESGNEANHKRRTPTSGR